MKERENFWGESCLRVAPLMEPLSVGHRPQKPEENTLCLLGGQAVNRPGYD